MFIACRLCRSTNFHLDMLSSFGDETCRSKDVQIDYVFILFTSVQRTHKKNFKVKLLGPVYIALNSQKVLNIFTFALKCYNSFCLFEVKQHY